MFSPEAAGPGSVAARNPRRRQRNASEDSVATRPNPKRLRRSALTDATFQPPEPFKLNGHASHDEDVPHPNGHPPEPESEPPSQQNGGAKSGTLAVRHKGSKRGERERRSHRHEGIELVTYPPKRCDVWLALTNGCRNRQRTRTMQ